MIAKFGCGCSMSAGLGSRPRCCGLFGDKGRNANPPPIPDDPKVHGNELVTSPTTEEKCCIYIGGLQTRGL